MNEADKKFMERAVELSAGGMKTLTGGPFGCVVVKDGKIIGEGFNQVTSTNDPTAHAEVVAIRNACRQLNSFQLDGCDIYTSCEPCPMCLGAIYWARPARVFFANTRHDAAEIEFDDLFIYEEIAKPVNGRTIPFIHLPVDSARKVFEQWKDLDNRIAY